MSHDELLVLLAGLSYEGHIEELFDRAAIASAYHTSEFQRTYQDVLTTLVLLGPARVQVPPYLAEGIVAEPLIREELLELSLEDRASQARRSVTDLYRRCFELSRRLEANPVTMGLRSFDDILGPTMSDRIDAATDASELTYYWQILRAYINPLVGGVADIFGTYWDSQAARLTSLLEDLNSSFLDSAAMSPLASGESLFETMGVGVRSGLRLYDGADSFSYTPEMMARLDEVDRLFAMPESFEDQFELTILLRTPGRKSNPRDTITIHSYWSSFFQLLGMLLSAESSGCSVLLPSSASVTPDKTPRVKTSADLIRVYRIYLTESGLLPKPTTFEDVLRLRENKHLGSLRRALARWQEEYAAAQDEPDLVQSIREEISSANAVTAQIDDLVKVGSLISYASLPVGVADAINGSLLGLFLSPIGPAIDSYRMLKLRRFGWVKFGR